MNGRPACGAQVVARWVSRSGRIATDQKAVRTRGPGRVVLGSKPQLATTKEKLVRWAGEQAAACDCQRKLVSWAARDYMKRLVPWADKRKTTTQILSLNFDS